MRRCGVIAALALGGVVGCREEIVLEGVANGWGAVFEFDDSEDGLAWATGFVPLSDGLVVPEGERRVLMVWDDFAMAQAKAPSDAADRAVYPAREGNYTTDGWPLGKPTFEAGLDDWAGEVPSISVAWDERVTGTDCCRDGRGNVFRANGCRFAETEVKDVTCGDRPQEPVPGTCIVDDVCPRGELKQVAEISLHVGVCATDAERRRVWCESKDLQLVPQASAEPSWTRLAKGSAVSCGTQGDELWCRVQGRAARAFGTGWTSIRPIGGVVAALRDGALAYIVTDDVSEISVVLAPDGSRLLDFSDACLVTTEGRGFCNPYYIPKTQHTHPGYLAMPGVWRDLHAQNSGITGWATQGDIFAWERIGETLDPTLMSARIYRGTWRKLAVAEGMSCASDEGGRIWCWGQAATGACTPPSRHDEAFLVPATAAGGWYDLRAGTGSTICARDETDTWACWGGAMSRPSRLCFIE